MNRRRGDLAPMKDQQSGVALFLSLIFLLLLTIVGVSGMKSAALQEKMAGNTRFKTISFQYAEAGLREGENIIAATNASGGLAACNACNGKSCEPPDFKRATAGKGNSMCGTWQASSDGRSLFQIQKLGTSSAAINMTLGESVTLYRVTSVATVSDATTALESIYAQK